MKNSQLSEFEKVVALLEELMQQNKINMLLKAWSRIKDHNMKNRKLFSNSSFAKTQPRFDLSEEQIKQIKTNRPRHNTMGNDKINCEENICLNLNNCSFSYPQEDYQFQDMILQRLKLMQSKLHYLKFKSFQRKRYHQHPIQTQRKSQQNLFKFKLNPRYIPMKKKLDTLQIMIEDTKIASVVDQASQKASLQSLPVSQTPKIGCINKKQSKLLKFSQAMDAFNLNNETQVTSNMQETFISKNQIQTNRHIMQKQQYYSDRFIEKKSREGYKIKKNCNSSRNKIKKQEIMDCENNPQYAYHPNLPLKKKEIENKKLDIFHKKQTQIKNNKFFI